MPSGNVMWQWKMPPDSLRFPEGDFCFSYEKSAVGEVVFYFLGTIFSTSEEGFVTEV